VARDEFFEHDDVSLLFSRAEDGLEAIERNG
jgi:hypothetical protein